VKSVALWRRQASYLSTRTALADRGSTVTETRNLGRLEAPGDAVESWTRISPAAAHEGYSSEAILSKLC